MQRKKFFDFRWGLIALLMVVLTACGGGEGAGVIPKASVTTNRAPKQVQLIEVSSSAPGALSVSWLPANDDSTPASAIKYQVHASTDANFTPNDSTLKFSGVGVTSAAIKTGLVAGNTYTIRLLAIDSDGVSTTSDSLVAKISDTTPINVSGAKVRALKANEVSAVTENSVIIKSGVSIPAINTFVSSTDANGGKGYLRKVVGVTTGVAETILKTKPASINEAVSDIQISSSFGIDAVPSGVATAAVQSGLATVNVSPEDGVQHTFNWPDSGFRYITNSIAETPSASLHQLGLNSFVASHNVTKQGTWGKVLGNNRIEISEGSVGTNVLTVAITDLSIPLTSKTPVGVCKVALGAITGTGDTSKPSGIGVSLGKFESVQWVAASNWIKVANQTLNISAAAGTATSAPYKVTATAYLDDTGDACSGTVWREKINFQLEIFVTTDKFPTKEATTKTFSGTAGFTVKNDIVNTFTPKVVFDKTISGAKLTYARIGVQAVSRLDQVLTIDATASGTIDKTLEIITPRKFFKVYMTPAGIPIVISGTLRMKMRVRGDVSGELNVTEKLSIGYDDISYGFEYKNGAYTPYSKTLPVYSLNVGGKGKAEANLTISLLPSLEVSAYESLTGLIVLEPYITASAGIEGFVQLGSAVDFNTLQTNMAPDADYRLTKTRLGAGVNAWLYADFSIFDTTVFVWPSTANKTYYSTYYKLVVMPNTTIMDLPKLSASLPTGAGTIHPQDACAIKVRGITSDVPNPLHTLFPTLPDAFIKWQHWTAPRIIAPLGVPSDSYGFLPDPNGEAGVFWARITKPGIYTVRVGGYSNWGTWARQYTEVTINATEGQTGSAGLRKCASGVVNTSPKAPTVLNAVSLWISSAYQSVKSIVWNFGAGIAEKTAAVANGVSTTVTQVFSTSGQKTVTATFKDSANTVLGTASATITVSNVTLITGATSDTTTTPGQILNNGTTDDTRPTLTGKLGATLNSGDHVNIYDGNVIFNTVAVASGKVWTFTPAVPLIGGAHSFTSEVVDFAGKPVSARSPAFVVNVSAPGVTAIAPAEAVRTVPTTFTVTGRDLPLSGLSVTVPSDTRATCAAPTGIKTTGFTVTCTFYKFDVTTNVQRELVISAATKPLGKVVVNLKSNITDVTWAAPSTGNVYGKGTIKFKENVTFKATGLNLLADPTMGFAVELCGVANKEVGTPTNTLRTFTCLFNNDAGAQVGHMAGVFKDALGGDGLYRFQVPVETAPVSAIGKLPDTGITASQCYAAGSDALVSCTSAAAIALNPKQDGMVGRDVSSASASDGKLGFSYSTVGSYTKEECVKDNITGLTWEGKPTTGTRAASATYTNYGDNRAGDASAYVAAVNAAKLCGYSDWRLPTADELQSIVDYSVADPGPTIDSTWFPNTQQYEYWTGTGYAGVSSHAWYVGFSSGHVDGYYRTYDYHVRLVR